MRKSLLMLTLLLSVLALTAAVPPATSAHWYGPGWGYSYAYPSYGWGYSYGGPRGYVAGPGGSVHIGGYGGIYRSYPVYKGRAGRVYYGWGW